ncbi:uncharacterized protein LOC117815048 isoform X2 [Notolabrus celidotus]|uniref:uncharacterized protein LOC117815048 isoform X2 n=1 Tax=Notolabrus celidotus TaxID=1203425 RepID=UPI001490817C|nr:uncharacterized protein LOC117815048 isoform X2 [Notolabrus celidotus]
MAGHLLFVLLCCFYEIQVQAFPPQAKLIVNSPTVTEKDSVTLNCWPGLSSVSNCYYKFGEEVRVLSCLETLTGTKLLQITHQSSPAEVQVQCYYTVKLGDINSPSPHSDVSSIIIHSVARVETDAMPILPTSIMTTDNVEEESQTLTTSTMSAGPMVGVSQSPSVTAPKQTSVNILTGVTLGKPGSTSIAPTEPASESWKWKVVVACFGVTGLILLGLTFLCTKRGTERCFNKRKQSDATGDVYIADNSVNMSNLDQGHLLPAGEDETFSVITSVPGAGTEKMKKEEQQNEESVVYHIYSAIPEAKPPSALKDMVYSTLQPHGNPFFYCTVKQKA